MDGGVSDGVRRTHLKGKDPDTMCDVKNYASITLPSFEHLLRVNRANNQSFFLKGFSHKFNNQINTILLGGEFLRNCAAEIERHFAMLESEPRHVPVTDSEQRDKFLSSMPKVIHAINSSARCLNLLVSRLPDITANENAAEGGVDVNRLASFCVSICDQQIGTFTDRFRLDLETGIPPLAGSPQQILQVIMNLLMNALLSLPGKACEVILSTSFDSGSGMVNVCMRDSGSGIPPEILPRITEPFFTTWEHHGCMGLGLTAADRIIRRHGGELTIESTPDHGTSVLVSLPVAADTAVCPREQFHA